MLVYSPWVQETVWETDPSWAQLHDKWSLLYAILVQETLRKKGDDLSVPLRKTEAVIDFIH